MPPEIRAPDAGGFKRWLERKRDMERAVEAPAEETRTMGRPMSAETARMMATMRGEDRDFTTEELAEIHGDQKLAHHALSRAVKAGLLTRPGRGLYRWAGGEPPTARTSAPKVARRKDAGPDLTRLRWLAEGYARGLTTEGSIVEEVLDLFRVTP